MKKILSKFLSQSLFILVITSPVISFAEDVGATATANEVKTVTSSDNRVVLLELYTSEGCSSCPPADRFLSELKSAGISDKQLIPIAFHVTYWDYIGWKDPFAKNQYDQRQRDQAHKQKKSSVYTPQFMLSGEDYRSYATFNDDVNKLTMQKATVNLELSARVLSKQQGAEKLQLNLKTDISASPIKDVGFYLAVIENNLASDVKDGENDGKLLHHDYVVRQLLGPYFQSQPENRLSREQTIILPPEWKRKDLSIVAYAENPHTGEVLQAVRLEY